MSSQGAAATAKAPSRPGLRLGLGGPGLTRGLVVGYISLMVLLPIAAVTATSLEGGIGAFWDASEDLDNACETCHVNYWYPNEGALLAKLDRRLEELYGVRADRSGRTVPLGMTPPKQ